MSFSASDSPATNPATLLSHLNPLETLPLSSLQVKESQGASSQPESITRYLDHPSSKCSLEEQCRAEVEPYRVIEGKSIKAAKWLNQLSQHTMQAESFKSEN